MSHEGLACSLDARAMSERRDSFSRLADDALIGLYDLGDAVLLRYRAGSGLEARLRSLVAAESSCCPFLDLELADRGEVLELRVGGPPEARPVIDGLLGIESAAVA